MPNRSTTPEGLSDARLHEILHLAWHVCESSEEDATTGTITVDAADFKALAEALPMEHPPHAFLPKGAKRHK